MKRQWIQGEPPKDGQKYEMQFVYENMGGTLSVGQWGDPGWWDAERGVFVSHNQFTGGVNALTPTPNRWRKTATPRIAAAEAD